MEPAIPLTSDAPIDDDAAPSIAHGHRRNLIPQQSTPGNASGRGPNALGRGFSPYLHIESLVTLDHTSLVHTSIPQRGSTVDH